MQMFAPRRVCLLSVMFPENGGAGVSSNRATSRIRRLWLLSKGNPNALIAVDACFIANMARTMFGMYAVLDPRTPSSLIGPIGNDAKAGDG